MFNRLKRNQTQQVSPEQQGLQTRKRREQTTAPGPGSGGKQVEAAAGLVRQVPKKGANTHRVFSGSSPGPWSERETRLRGSTSTSADAVMDHRNLQQEFEDQFNDVVSRLQSKQLFQSDWDIASFAVFFIFIGMVLMMVILVLIRCCCCCCCDEDKPRRHKIGVDNMALDP